MESSDSIKVTTYDGTSYDAQLIGYDESNDIAVLKIDATDLTPVVLGDSDTLNVGDSVVAIGNPLGELTFSLTTGVVSALDRPVTFSTGSTMNLIQTDCAINSGNSGARSLTSTARSSASPTPSIPPRAPLPRPRSTTSASPSRSTRSARSLSRSSRTAIS